MGQFLPDSSFDTENLVITVPESLGTTLEIQDLYNDVRTFEAKSKQMDGLVLGRGTGKQSLGGTNQVGITFEFLNNWLVGFAARAGPAVIACRILGGNLTSKNLLTGDNDTFNADGEILEDTTSAFGFTAVQTGEALRNVTTGATATVIDVTAIGILTCTPLKGGVPDNQWNVGDVYEIDSFHPVFPTAFTHITISQDTAALGIKFDQGDANLLRKVFLNRAVTTILGDTSKQIDFYDDDQVAIIETIFISIDGNERTNPS